MNTKLTVQDDTLHTIDWYLPGHPWINSISLQEFPNIALSSTKGKKKWQSTPHFIVSFSDIFVIFIGGGEKDSHKLQFK